MNELVLWALICFAIAVLLFLAEVLIPSGGILGLGAAVALVAGVVLLFGVDTTYGLLASVIALAAIPFLIGFAIKLWPQTPIARWLTLKSPTGGAAGSEAGGAEEAGSSEAAGAGGGPPPAHPLLGAEGEAITDLHPVGTCLLREQREQCLAVGSMIEAGTRVRVVAADGMQIKVKPVAR